jgi:hypothetical protein
MAIGFDLEMIQDEFMSQFRMEGYEKTSKALQKFREAQAHFDKKWADVIERQGKDSWQIQDKRKEYTQKEYDTWQELKNTDWTSEERVSQAMKDFHAKPLEERVAMQLQLEGKEKTKQAEYAFEQAQKEFEKHHGDMYDYSKDELGRYFGLRKHAIGDLEEAYHTARDTDWASTARIKERIDLMNAPTKVEPPIESKEPVKVKEAPVKKIEPAPENKPVVPEPKPKPPVNQIKVEQATETIKQATQKENTKTPVSPPKPVESTPPKMQTSPAPPPPDIPHMPKTDIPNTKSVSSFLKHNHGKIIMGAIGAGIIKSMVDNEDDDILSSAGTGLKAGLYAAGASYVGQELFKSQTVQDLVKGEINQAAKDMKTLQTEDKLLKIGKKIPHAMGIGMIAIGAAAVLDIGQRVGSHMDAEAYKRQQEWEMKQRVKKQKSKNKEQSYGYVNNGEIVLDLFSARTGHYKMGNARFQ